MTAEQGNKEILGAIAELADATGQGFANLTKAMAGLHNQVNAIENDLRSSVMMS